MTVSEAKPSERDQSKERFREVQVNVLSLLCEFVYWNDVMRYPDLPRNSERPGRRAAAERNRINRDQMRFFADSKEDSIVLNVWKLLYDDGQDSPPNLQVLARGLNNPRKFPDRQPSKTLTDCCRYLNRDSFRKRFDLHRNNFIAHLSSVQPSTENVVDYDYIYRVVPKTIYLVELLHEKLEDYPSHFGNQFTVTALEAAPYFSHSKPDQLLAELFASRSLPRGEFEMAVKRFLEASIERQKAAHPA
jgi:hypothetical protein